MLIDHLPAESALMTALRNAAPQGEGEPGEEIDPSKGPWSLQEMLLASAVDELRGANWLYVAAHSDEGKAGRPPSPIPRPGVKPKQARARLTMAQRRMLDPRLRVQEESVD